MELYVSGVEVPKLGSLKDRMLRQYLARKANKEIALNKMLAQIASASGGPGNDAWHKSISSTFNNYVNMELYLEGEIEKREDSMMQDFEYWKTVKPVAIIGKDGGLTIKGIL